MDRLLFGRAVIQSLVPSVYVIFSSLDKILKVVSHTYIVRVCV